MAVVEFFWEIVPFLFTKRYHAGMANKLPFDPLHFDVTYAIAKSLNTPKSFVMKSAEPLAKDIIAHLHMSGWRFDRKSPAGDAATTGKLDEPKF